MVVLCFAQLPPWFHLLIDTSRYFFNFVFDLNSGVWKDPTDSWCKSTSARENLTSNNERNGMGVKVNLGQHKRYHCNRILYFHVLLGRWFLLFSVHRIFRLFQALVFRPKNQFVKLLLLWTNWMPHTYRDTAPYTSTVTTTAESQLQRIYYLSMGKYVK